MNLFSFLLGAVFLAWAPLSFAEALDCVPDSGCKDDDEPPSCCEPPPCEFFYAVMAARAQVRAATGEWLQGVLELDAADPDAALSDYVFRLRDEMDAELQKLTPCPQAFFFQKPPALQVLQSKNCQIGIIDESGSFQPTTAREVKQKSNSCEELIDAEFAYAERQQKYCRKSERAKKAEPLKHYAFRRSLDFDARAWSLEWSLLNYWAACSMVADAETARRVAETGIAALKDAVAEHAELQMALQAARAR